LISIIAAMANNRVIGKNGKLPWHLPEDLKRFRQLTEDHIIIMGRKTFESIGRALPRRVNMVITGRKDYDPGGAIRSRSLDAAIEHAMRILENRAPPPDGEIFVIGGALVYREAMEKAEKIYLTRIDADFEGDTFFPEIDPEKWETESCVLASPDPFPYYFITMVRKIKNTSA